MTIYIITLCLKYFLLREDLILIKISLIEINIINLGSFFNFNKGFY